MSTLQLNHLSAIIKDRRHQVAMANACDKAYAVGTGNPDWYSPYGEEKPEKVAQNLAGPLAVNSAVGIIAQMRNLPTDGNVVSILQDIVSDNVSDLERTVLYRVANATWAAGQPFRTDKGPLGRAGGVNVFDLLDPVEVDKDWNQIAASADYLLKAFDLAKA
jgi:hypothetical protein